MVWRPDGPQGNEAAKVRYDIVPFTRGRGLDLGCGPQKAYPHMIGVDSCKDAELFGIQIKPDMRVDTCEDLSIFGTESFDFVFSSHLLEHIEDHTAALREWWRVVRQGGYLVLYLPHKDLYPRIGTSGANPDHVHDFCQDDIIDAMREVTDGWTLRWDEKRAEGTEYSFLQVYQKPTEAQTPKYRNDSFQVRKLVSNKPRALVCRFGGFGDMLQAANLFPELKRQGYQVTVMTTPSGMRVIENDPHVDDWVIQDKDQVPNGELPAYWDCWSRKYDKFVNLSESVEGTFLPTPGRANHAWPDSVRRKYLGRNYLEFASELAEIPYASEAVFYPSAEETKWATEYLKGWESKFVIVWALAGSSVHKFYPGQDSVIAELLLKLPDVRIIFTGDYACKILESGWENEPRIKCASGELNIRQTLTLAKRASCVVGPETGVLNAVAFESKVSKVILLSHSSKENLTKHWCRTVTVTPPTSVSCYPCHRLHYTRDFCPEDKASGASVCQAAINPTEVIMGVAGFYSVWDTMRRMAA